MTFSAASMAMIAAGEASSSSLRFGGGLLQGRLFAAALGDVLEDGDEVLRLGAERRDVQAQAERLEVDLKLLGPAAGGDAAVGLEELGFCSASAAGLERCPCR